LTLLVDRGALRITEDGTVAGGDGLVERAPPARDENPDSPKLGPMDWKKEWPHRLLLMSLLDSSQMKPVKFRWVQAMLAERRQPASHWITLHAIWHLMKHGFAEKVGGGYRLTDAGGDQVTGYPDIEGESPEVTPAIEEKFRTMVGEMPSEMVDVINLVISEKEVSGTCKASEFSSTVGMYQDSGKWMCRPEMRGGFSLPFVRWAQARHAKNGSIT
jgi:hypothetical protein